jgi:hypothetical protein
VLQIVIPASLQAIGQTCRSLSRTAGISLRGFESGQIAEFFARHFPDAPLLAPGAYTNGQSALIVHRDEGTLARDQSVANPAEVMVLERLLDHYRVTNARIDLNGF